MRPLYKIVIGSFLILCSLNSFSQELDTIRSLKLMFEPIQEVTADQVGNPEVNGVLGSLPAGIDVKVKAEILVADTSNLSKIYVTLGTQQGGVDLLNTFVDIQLAMALATEKFFMNDHYIIVDLGTYPKPEFMSCDVYFVSRDMLKSPVTNFQTR